MTWLESFARRLNRLKSSLWKWMKLSKSTQPWKLKSAKSRDSTLSFLPHFSRSSLTDQSRSRTWDLKFAVWTRSLRSSLVRIRTVLSTTRNIKWNMMSWTPSSTSKRIQSSRSLSWWTLWRRKKPRVLKKTLSCSARTSQTFLKMSFKMERLLWSSLRCLTRICLRKQSQPSFLKQASLSTWVLARAFTLVSKYRFPSEGPFLNRITKSTATRMSTKSTRVTHWATFLEVKKLSWLLA